MQNIRGSAPPEQEQGFCYVLTIFLNSSSIYGFQKIFFFHWNNQNVQQWHIENISPPMWSNITTKNRTQIFDRLQMLNTFIIYFCKWSFLKTWAGCMYDHKSWLSQPWLENKEISKYWKEYHSHRKISQQLCQHLFLLDH